MMRTALLCVGFLILANSSDAQTVLLPFEIRSASIHRELSPDSCWFHPRIVSVPSDTAEQSRLLVCTLQKHFRTSDHFSGLYVMRSADLGRTWSTPTPPAELDCVPTAEGSLCVCDVTPGWHLNSRKLIAVGTRVRYDSSGKQLLDAPRSHQIAWAVWDPKTDRWSAWRTMTMPEELTRHFLTAPGCVQWHERPDGRVLLPVYCQPPGETDYSAQVLLCDFDGQTLSLSEEGPSIRIDGGRGFVEPSIAFFQGQWLLTLRNDVRGYVTRSLDGLHYDPPLEWKFDDGQDLGSYNTQQHWLVHHKALFLCYTRRGSNNDHIPRNRAPLFMAQVDPVSLRVIRSTEQILLPERGVMLGNFGAAAISPDESVVSDAEFLLDSKPHPRGADGSVLLARVKWPEPNQSRTATGRPRIVVLGDSITRGVRSGVAADEIFSSRLQTELRSHEIDVDVINLGIGGERSDQALARLSRDVLALEPRLVTIMYGTNDSYVDQGQSDSRITADEFASNLKRIVSELRRCGIVPILMTEPRWGPGAGPNGVQEHPNVRLERFLDKTRMAATEMKVDLVDHYLYWQNAESAGTNISSWMTDECHPNAAGHEQIADQILPVILPHLNDLRNRDEP